MVNSICILTAGKLLNIAATVFTLSWVHSVEKTQWQEEWELRGDQLHIVSARVKGSGAGMDPAEGSRLVDGWWVWAPPEQSVPELILAASGATGSGWEFCVDDSCLTLGEEEADPVHIQVCKSE